MGSLLPRETHLFHRSTTETQRSSQTAAVSIDYSSAFLPSAFDNRADRRKREHAVGLNFVICADFTFGPLRDAKTRTQWTGYLFPRLITNDGTRPSPTFRHTYRSVPIAVHASPTGTHMRRAVSVIPPYKLPPERLATLASRHCQMLKRRRGGTRRQMCAVTLKATRAPFDVRVEMYNSPSPCPWTLPGHTPRERRYERKSDE